MLKTTTKLIKNALKYCGFHQKILIFAPKLKENVFFDRIHE